MKEPSLKFLHGAHTPFCTTKVDKAFEGYRSLQLMTQGAVELWYGDDRHELAGRWVWPAMPGPWIRFHPAPDVGWWEHRYVAFSGDLAEQWTDEGLLPTGPVSLPDNADYPRLFDQLFPLMHRLDAVGQRRAVNLLERVLLGLAEAKIQPAAPPTWLQDAYDLLGDLGEVDYEAVARDVGMAYSTLRKRFREASGMSLHQYVLQRRMADARRMLVETELPIQQIAADLGYRDVYYFNRQFSRQTGLPPGRYRRTRQV